jgi:hypothetical protein
MKKHQLNAAAVAGAAALLLGGASAANAGGVISFGDDQSISVGFGMRTQFSSTQNGAPNGGTGNDIDVSSLRLYISGSLNSWLKGTFNTERGINDSIILMDGYVQIEPTDGFNVWVGRLLPPSDRSNLDGPYYLNTWNYPMVSQYPSVAIGRDDGAVVWGKLFAKKLVYSVGVFQGHNDFSGASDQAGNFLYAGRLAVNILDPEPAPAYYTGSTYYGAANILTVAFAGQYEKAGVGTAALAGDYKAYNFDILYENKMSSAGSVTLEGAYYNYNTGGVVDVASNYNGAGAYANVGGITQGTAYLAGADYLFPGKVAVGQFQPTFRYQHFDNTLSHVDTNTYDAGVNFIISGPNAKISAIYTKSDPSVGKANNAFVLGIQVQY